MQPITPSFLVGLFVATVIGTLLAFEAGLRLGRWRSRQPNPEAPLPVRVLVTSTLGLLSFMLGITFGLASSHFDNRSQSIFDEATAIGAAYHRADLLPEPERTNERQLIRKYVDARLEPLDGQTTVTRLRTLQEQMWREAVGASRKDGAGSFVMPFAQSMIEISAQSERVLTDIRSRVPVVVWIILNSIMAVSVAAAGYHAGLAGTQRSIAALAYALVFAAVIVLITGADSPGVSQLRTSHQALVDLRERLKTP